MAVTMKDIAQDLGVSVVTVSKVLRNHSDISAETCKRRGSPKRCTCYITTTSFYLA